MRNKLSRHSDIVFLTCTVCAFVLGAGFLLLKWRIGADTWESDDVPPPLVDRDDIENIGTRDFIIPIDNPLFESVENARNWLMSDAPVLVFVLYDEARAYPLNILLHHEIINDTMQNRDVAITFCPGCNSAIIFDRTVNGTSLRLGVSGYVYNSGFIMMDEESNSYWKQFTGEAISGAYTGTILEIIPSIVVGFEAYAERYPQGLVLAGDADNPRNYDMNPYIGYDSNPQPMLGSSHYDSRLEPLQHVLAAIVDDVPVSYPFTMLQAEGVIHDIVNDAPLVAFWMPGAVSVLDAASIEDSRDIGQTALFNRTLADGRELTFRYDNGRIYDNQTDSEWSIFGEAIRGELIGEYLYRYQSFSYFWFAWSSTYPETLVYTE
ncbi:MAG: DUF3179 domain-containing protein [Anaerolineae bacterium]|nr:DUF3179 domain-containing protein [Anaerolineae bacterium]